MPPVAESPLKTSRALRRVTEGVARHDALAIDVCKAGQCIALHFATLSGVVIVTTDLREFVTKCRGPRDYLGNRIPNPSEFVAVFEGEATAGPDDPRPASSAPSRYDAAWDYLRAHLDLPLKSVAELCGIGMEGFKGWLRKTHPGELARLRAAVGLGPRAGRFAPATDGNAPVFKPSGKLL